jgi:hypothetical protein
MKSPRQELVPEEEVQAKAPKHIMLTKGNLTLLRLIHTYRLLRIRDLELLTARAYQRLHRRLKALADNRYLGRLRRPLKKDIYYIARLGLAALLEEGWISDEEAERRVREGELKSDEFLNHELMIADLHVILELAISHSPMRLMEWKEGKEIHFSFPAVVNGQAQEIQIEPDAFFTLQDTRRPEGKNTRSFVLEADRSTMGKKERPGSRRMSDKFQKYEYSLRESRIFKKYEVTAIRVLTVTRTQSRRDSLAATASQLMNETYRKYFLFGSLEDLSFDDPASLFHPVFQRPGEVKAARELMPFAENQPSA